MCAKRGRYNNLSTSAPQFPKNVRLKFLPNLQLWLMNGVRMICIFNMKTNKKQIDKVTDAYTLKQFWKLANFLKESNNFCGVIWDEKWNYFGKIT